MQQPVQGVTPPLLQQDWQTGFWTVMPEGQIMDYIYIGLRILARKSSVSVRFR